MERWLSKSRVLLGLCAVLLLAALNRQDPMVYGMFLFLVVVTGLGFGLPWLSLRGTTVRLASATEVEVIEGSAQLEQHAIRIGAERIPLAHRLAPHDEVRRRVARLAVDGLRMGDNRPVEPVGRDIEGHIAV